MRTGRGLERADRRDHAGERRIDAAAINLAKCVYEFDGVAATSSVTLSGGLSDTLGGAIWNVATLCGGALYFEGGRSADVRRTP